MARYLLWDFHMIVTVPMLLLALLLSFLVGGSLGLLGGGGSILTMPIVLYVLGLEAHEAIATSLLVVGATSAAALIAHVRGGRVRWRVGLLFGAASMSSAYLAGSAAQHVPGALLLVGFGSMMAVAGVAMMRRREEPAPVAFDGWQWLRLGLLGLGAGSLTGFVGAGGGFVVVPALALLGGLSIRQAVGTSLLVITLNSTAALAGHLGGTQLPWGLAAAITSTAIAGSFVGGTLAGKVPQGALRRAFAWFILVMAAFFLLQELPRAFGVEVGFRRDWPWILGGVAIPLLLGLLDLRRSLERIRVNGSESTPETKETALQAD